MTQSLLGQVRAKGWYTTDTTNTAGAAVEIGVSGGIGYMMHYDRDNGSYRELRISSGNTFIRLSPSDSIKISEDGTNFHKIWHSGNDGASSGLDADKLDGLHASNFVRSDASDTVTGLLTMSRSGECLRLRGSASTTSPYLSFYQQDTRRAYIQFNDSTNTLNLFNDVYDEYLKIGNGAGGLVWNNGGTDYTVYHTGNLPTIPTVSSSSQYILSASGSYGTVRVNDNRGVGWAGYAIRDDWVFMSSSAETCGIYNDTDNEWGIICRQNAEVELFHNGVMKLETTSAGATVSGSPAVTGNVTHQNGARLSPIDQWSTDYTSSSKRVYSIEAEGFMGSSGSSLYGPDYGYSSFYVNQVAGKEGTVSWRSKDRYGYRWYYEMSIRCDKCRNGFLGGRNQ